MTSSVSNPVCVAYNIYAISTCVIKDQKIIVIINKNCMIEDLGIYEDREEAVGKGVMIKILGKKVIKEEK